MSSIFPPCNSPNYSQIDISVFVDMPEANETTKGSVPNYAGLMTWLHDHMSKGGESGRAGGGAVGRDAPPSVGQDAPLRWPGGDSWLPQLSPLTTGAQPAVHPTHPKGSAEAHLLTHPACRLQAASTCAMRSI